jgi:archaellum component FlaD/FlaE
LGDFYKAFLLKNGQSVETNLPACTLSLNKYFLFFRLIKNLKIPSDYPANRTDIVLPRRETLLTTIMIYHTTMAVNQAQVDHIITAASEDDPEVKLQNLEREVDLIKTSIKRLLMDIRERMNELENPFTLAVAMTGKAAPAKALAVQEEAEEVREPAAVKKETEPMPPPEQAKMPAPAVPAPAPAPVAPQPSFEERRLIDEQLLAQFKAQIPVARAPLQSLPQMPGEKIRLQKVYKLFKWTDQAVRKYGHDRLEIILQSYRTMGHISKDACDEIREEGSPGQIR